MVYAAIRVRGAVNVNRDIEHTMGLMGLTRVNHLVLLSDNKEMKGMLNKTKDYITWGEVSAEALSELIVARGRLMGDSPIIDDYLKENTDFADVQAFAEGIVDGSVRYKDLENVKPVFRMSPPRKGYEGIKRSYKAGGALGYRGEDINDLIKRML